MCLSTNIFFLISSCDIFWERFKKCVLMHTNFTKVKSENKLFKHNESRENLSSPFYYCYLNAIHFMKNFTIKFCNIKSLGNLFPYSLSIEMPQNKAHLGEHRRGGVTSILRQCTPYTGLSGPSASAVPVNSTTSLVVTP